MRDFDRAKGQSGFGGDFAVRQVAEIGTFDKFPLLRGKRADRLHQFARLLVERDHIGLVGLLLGAPGQVFGFGSGIAAQEVDLAVPRDREDPRRDRGTRTGSYICALCQSVAITSCMHSSARLSSAPDFIRNALTLGAKCRNTSAKGLLILVLRNADDTRHPMRFGLFHRRHGLCTPFLADATCWGAGKVPCKASSCLVSVVVQRQHTGLTRIPLDRIKK